MDTVLGARFREAGFVTIGKTNTPELGIVPTTEPEAYGPTHNPWDLGRSVLSGLVVLLAGTALLRALRRASRRAAFDAVPVFTRQE